MPQPNIANQTGSVLAAYDREIAEGAIEADAAQHQAIKLLDQLSQELAEVRPLNRSLLSVFKRTPPPLPRGLYLHGGVGRGKTMLMDMFFANTDFELKRRDHFHQFMAEIDDRIGVARSSSDAETDPIAHVAKAIAPEPML
ncbi:MAG: AFG1/ZapE family ATPase, partial [Pseudomonadota bacterium]